MCVSELLSERFSNFNKSAYFNISKISLLMRVFQPGINKVLLQKSARYAFSPKGRASMAGDGGDEY